MIKNREKTVLMHAEPSGDYADYLAGRLEVFTTWGQPNPLTGLPERPLASWEVSL